MTPHFDPSNGDVYVTNFGSNDVSVIDGSTNMLLPSTTTTPNPIPVGTNPDGGVFSDVT